MGTSQSSSPKNVTIWAPRKTRAPKTRNLHFAELASHPPDPIYELSRDWRAWPPKFQRETFQIKRTLEKHHHMVLVKLAIQLPFKL